VVADMRRALESAVCCFVVALGLAEGEQIREVGKYFVPDLVCIQEDLVLGHLLLGEVVAFVHLPNKVEGFGFVGNDDVDHLAFFLLLGELPAKCDDVGHVGCPCLIEGFGGISAFPCHPVGSEMVENTFDGVVGVPEVLFVEFFDILFFNAVDDALDTKVGDRLLQANFFLSFFVSSWKVRILRGVDVAVLPLLMASG
jgi:hypothetical protein